MKKSMLIGLTVCLLLGLCACHPKDAEPVDGAKSKHRGRLVI